MNGHPDELLAEYVDGSLGADDRARVEAHLASCSTCSEEVAAAAEARTVLTALPEVPVPFGTTQRVLRHARRRPRWSSPFAWRAAGLAAAAAAVVGVVVYVGNSSREHPEEPAGVPERVAAPEGAADEPVPAPAEGAFAVDAALFPRYTESETDYTPETLTAATRRFATDAKSALDQGFPPTARDFYTSYDLRSLVEPAQKAVGCVNTEIRPDRPVVPFVIEAARFRGSPAYLVVYLRGTDPETPYDRIQVLVVDRKSCGILHFARQNL